MCHSFACLGFTYLSSPSSWIHLNGETRTISLYTLGRRNIEAWNLSWSLNYFLICDSKLTSPCGVKVAGPYLRHFWCHHTLLESKLICDSKLKVEGPYLRHFWCHHTLLESKLICVSKLKVEGPYLRGSERVDLIFFFSSFSKFWHFFHFTTEGRKTLHFTPHFNCIAVCPL